MKKIVYTLILIVTALSVMGASPVPPVNPDGTPADPSQEFPPLQLYPVEAHSEYYDTLKMVCDDTRNFSYAERTSFCDTVALETYPPLLDLVASPSYLRRYDEATLQILERGFNYLSPDMSVRGFKSISPDNLTLNRYNTFSLDIFTKDPYNYILAEVVADDNDLIPNMDLTPYLAYEANAEQYLDMRRLLGDGYTAAHYNLCGPLVVADLTQADLQQFFSNMRAGIPWANDWLKTGESGLYIGAVESIFKMYDWKTELTPAENTLACEDTGYNTGIHDRMDGDETLCQLKKYLNDGSMVVTGGNLTTDGGYGIMIPRSYTITNDLLNAYHWVVVLQTVQSQDGYTYVRIYNPFHNREEYYLWNEFYENVFDGYGFTQSLVVSPIN